MWQREFDHEIFPPFATKARPREWSDDLAGREAGANRADPCHKHGMLKDTFYNWKAKSGDMMVPEAKRLRALQNENAKMMKLVSEKQFRCG